ncbi:MAG: DUF6596 domain-containing protein, partial [Flexibacteraceae bacterium]
AISLLRNLVEHKSGLGQKPEVFALLALFCFHAARFDARSDANNKQILLEKQDYELWNQRLINFGEQFLNKASTGTTLTVYHLEAAIACLHTRIYLPETEKWKQITVYYKQLLSMSDTLLGRISLIVAVYKSEEVQEAYQLWTNLFDKAKNNYFFQQLGFHIYKALNEELKAKECLSAALSLANSEAEKLHIEGMIAEFSK